MIILIRLPEVKKLTGLSKSSIYAMMNESDFPRSIKIGNRAVGWLESEISDWIKQRISQSRKESI